MAFCYGVFLLFIMSLVACSTNAPNRDSEQKRNEHLPAQADLSNGALNQISFSQVMELSSKANTSEKIAYGENSLQYGHLYLPVNVKDAEGVEKAPLVIFIHGGCWLNAYGVGHTVALSQALAKEGYAVWSIEYRRSGDEGGGWPGSLNDVLKGVSFAQTFKGYPIDLNKVVLVGHSAGGHLALLASAEQRHVFKGGATLKGVIGLAAIVDVIGYSQGANSCQAATSTFFAGSAEQKTEAYQAATPTNYTLPSQTLLLQGSADEIVHYKEAQESGLNYQIVGEAGHFDWIHPEANAYQIFLSILKQWVKDE
jgi:acetyl esterase/lipase